MGKRVIQRLQIATAALVLSLSTILGALPMLANATPAITLGGVSSVSGTTGDAVSLSGLTLSGTPSATTSIQLRASHGEIELSNTTGVTLTSSNPASVLSYTGTVANINASFAYLTYTRASGNGNDTIEVNTVGEGQVYYPGNGHVYELVEVDNPGIDWTNAKVAAEAKTAYGMTGYLATITSEGENQYVADRLTGPGWMGASDAASEGVWKWVGGPENGTTFCIGNYSIADGGTICEPQSGRYSNWSDQEPNDSGDDEDCAQFLSGGNGKWNDLPCSGSELESYVVEYGADDNLPEVASKNIDVSISAAVRTVSTCSELTNLGSDFAYAHDMIKLDQDIDCHGATVDPLFTWNGFYGTFDGQGHTIKNFNIDGWNNSYAEGGQVGLFVYAEGATIKNLTLAGGTVSGSNYVGAVVGEAYHSTIKNVHSSMTVEGHYQGIGGLVGRMISNDSDKGVFDSSVTGTVNGNSRVGGLVGEVAIGDDGELTFEHSFVTGDVTASADTAGGLLGYVTAEGYGDTLAQILIQDVYTQGDVSVGVDSGAAGGLIGHLEVHQDGGPTDITIRRAYASGSVTGDFKVGGLIGELEGPDSDHDVSMTIRDAFAAGKVTALYDDVTVGGLIGDYVDEGYPVTWENMYYDATRTTQDVCVGGDETPGACTVKNENGQQGSYFFKKKNAPMTSWNFTTIWLQHNDTYPTFRTDVAIDDDDADGISAADEQAAPNNGDANGDGVADEQQSNVSSFRNNQTEEYVALEVSDECSNTSATVAGEASKAVQDSGFKYPGGLISFSSVCGSNGFEARITQYYYGVSGSSLVARKYNPNTSSYYDIQGATISAVTIGGKSALKVSYLVKDGDPHYDLDGVANGTIVDPAGPAQSDVGTPNTGAPSVLTLLSKPRES